MVFQDQPAEPADQANALPDPKESAVVEWLTESPRAFRFAIGPKGFLLGSAPGCDVRLGFPNPPVLAFLRYDEGSLLVRLLAPQTPFLVDDQNAPNEVALAMGSSFSLAGQKARVLFVAPRILAAPAPSTQAVLGFPTQVQVLPDGGPIQDPQTPLWAPIVDQLREEAERFQQRQQELASLSEALESQAQVIDRWHAHLTLEESKLQERLAHLEQKEKQLDARVAAAPPPAHPNPYFAEAEALAKEKQPISPFPSDANLDFARLYFPQPLDLAPADPHDAPNFESASDQALPDSTMTASAGYGGYGKNNENNEHSETENDHRLEASVAWPEDDSWDFLHGGTESVPAPPTDPTLAVAFDVETAVRAPLAAEPPQPPFEELASEPDLVSAHSAVKPTDSQPSPAEPEQLELSGPVSLPVPSPAAAPIGVSEAEIAPTVDHDASPTATVPGPPTKVRVGITKANAEIIKGNAEIIKGNAEIIKGNAEIQAPSLKITPAALASPNLSPQEWKAPASFDDWFLWQWLQLDASQLAAWQPLLEPVSLSASSGSSLAGWLERGWIRQETAAGLASLARAENLPLDRWLEQKHPGWIDWTGEIDRFPARFSLGAYLILEGDPATDSFLEAVHTATGRRAVLIAKPAGAKTHGITGTSPEGAPATNGTWDALVELEHENITPLTAILDHNHRTWGLWEVSAGRRLPELTRVSPALGIWYRLFLQATLGLRALHQANLSHGAIGPGSFVLQPGGLLSFLQVSRLQAGAASAEIVKRMPKDLQDLGSLGWQWLEKIFGEREKSDWKKWLPATLWELLDRLDPSSGSFPKMASVEELAHELDRLGLQIRANPFTWASFLDRQFPGRQNQANETHKISA